MPNDPFLRSPVATALSSRDDSDSDSMGPSRPPTPPTMPKRPVENTIWIALIGLTGTGKSTFISKCVDQHVPIGDSLESCTQDVALYSFDHASGVKVNLVDTPGFDDTNLSDLEILQTLAGWLKTAYEHQIQLNGIIYLHRITDLRMQGSAKKNLSLFKAICGLPALSNVTLATTHWEKVSQSEGARRERELAENEDYWGWMTRHGSRIVRHYDTKESALRLIELYLSNGKSVALEIQEEMVTAKKPLDRTQAGMELERELLKERGIAFKDLAETRGQMQDVRNDREAMLQLQRHQEEVDQKIRLLEEKKKELAAGILKYEASGSMKQAFASAQQEARRHEYQHRQQHDQYPPAPQTPRRIGDGVINGIWILSNSKIRFSESSSGHLAINSRMPRNRRGEPCPYDQCVKTEMGPRAIGFLPNFLTKVPAMGFYGGGVITLWSGFDQAFIDNCREISTAGFTTTHWVEAMDEPAVIEQDASGRLSFSRVGAARSWGAIGSS